MRIMATSDLHGNLDGLDPTGADVVVLAGDVAPLRGRGPWHINDQKKWINKRFREWTASYPDVQFVVIPGNHDFYPIAHILFKGHDIDWTFGFSPNVHFLGDCAAEINGIRFYGTPWVPIISYSWAFEGEPDTLRQWFSKIPSAAAHPRQRRGPFASDGFRAFRIVRAGGGDCGEMSPLRLLRTHPHGPARRRRF